MILIPCINAPKHVCNDDFADFKQTQPGIS